MRVMQVATRPHSTYTGKLYWHAIQVAFDGIEPEQQNVGTAITLIKMFCSYFVGSRASKDGHGIILAQ